MASVAQAWQIQWGCWGGSDGAPPKPPSQFLTMSEEEEVKEEEKEEKERKKEAQEQNEPPKSLLPRFATACPLIGPVAVGAEDWPEHSAQVADSSAASTSTSNNNPTATSASASTTIGRVVEFWLKITQDGVLSLYTNQLETLDPYGGDPIKSFLKVICTHEGLFLLHLHTDHANFPTTDYFVWDCNLRGRRPRVCKLPLIKQPTHSRSMGLWRTADNGCFVVANLLQELDWEKRLPKTYLDCYYYQSPSNKDNDDDSPSNAKDDGRRWIRITREVEFLQEDGCCSADEALFGWRTDLIIPFDDGKHKALLWVDFSRGMLLCNVDDLSSKAGKIKLHFVPHPLDLFPKGDPRWEHPHPYCSLGRCSNGKLKLISLPSAQNDDACVVVQTWTLAWDHHEWKEKTSTSLDHESLLRNSKVPSSSLPELQKLADSSLCYPIILGTAKGNGIILCLTLVIESQARLLRINMGTCSIDGVADYPSFFDHMNPPYPCYLSKDLKEDEGVTEIKRAEDDMDRQRRPKRSRPSYFKKFIIRKFKKLNPFICIIS